jgi:pimeloyl-ACP methyl ester carboxylesterase
MNIKQIKQNFFAVGILFFTSQIISCATFNHKNPYPNMEIARYANSQAYILGNKTSSALIVNLDGSGWDSTLGEEGARRWLSVHLGAQLLQVLGKDYAFLIPEKLKRGPGKNHFYDMDDRANYTAENLIACYLDAINGYLVEHDVSTIVLIGVSEGACLLPLIYERMNEREKVAAMVSYGFGGFSLYESYAVLSNRQNIPEDWVEMYRYFVETYAPGKAEYPNSYEEDVYGFATFRWFNSFKDIKPFDYYKNVDIPVLFIHGENDYNIPVESTRYVQDHLPEKPFAYSYYDWAHYPGTYAGIIKLRNNIGKWVMKK